MTSKNDILIHFALERWSDSEAATDRLHTKAVALATLSLAISASTYAMINASIIGGLFVRIDIFLYYLAALCTVLATIAVWFFVAATMLPRSKYKNIAGVTKFQNKFSSDEFSGDDLSDAIVKKIGECELHNREIDERRMRLLKRGFIFALMSPVCLLACGFFRFILVIGGLL